MNINEAVGILPLYDEIMDRQREGQEVEAAMRDEKIEVIQKEYIEDVGTFFEFIQSIEIDIDNSSYYENLHKDILRGDCLNVSDRITDIYMCFCKEKVIKEEK